MCEGDQASSSQSMDTDEMELFEERRVQVEEYASRYAFFFLVWGVLLTENAQVKPEKTPRRRRSTGTLVSTIYPVHCSRQLISGC